MYYTLKEEFGVRIGKKTSYIYNKVNMKEKYGKLNDDSIMILKRINEGDSYYNMMNNLMKLSDETIDEVEKPVNDFLNKNIYFKWSDTPQKNNFIQYIDDNVPFRALVELTYNCNLYCKHCYNNSGSHRSEYIDQKELFKLLDKLSSDGVIAIDFSGGEPLLYPNFLEVLEYAFNKFDLVQILTNATLINKTHIELFNKYKNKIYLQFNFNGLNKEYVDKFNGLNGSYEALIKVLKLVEPFYSIVSFNITKENVEDIYSTAKFLKENKVNQFNASLSMNIGRAESNNIEYDSETLIEMQNQMKKVENIYPEHVKVTNEAFKRAKTGHKCGAGTDTLVITPNGDVKPCPSANINDFYLGNIFDEEIYDNLSKIEKLDIPQEKYCKDCQYENLCLNCFVRGIKQYKKIGINVNGVLK